MPCLFTELLPLTSSAEQFMSALKDLLYLPVKKPDSDGVIESCVTRLSNRPLALSTLQQARPPKVQLFCILLPSMSTPFFLRTGRDPSRFPLDNIYILLALIY